MTNAIPRLCLVLTSLFLFSSCNDGLDLSTINVGPDNTVSWEDAVKIITHGEVDHVFQTHALEVGITLKDGTRYQTTEPHIDEVFRVLEKAGKKDQIAIMTE